MADIVPASIPPPFRLARPKVHLTATDFLFSKPSVIATHPGRDDPSTSTVSLSSVPSLGKPEVIINGCAQGNGWRAPGHTLLKDKQRSRLSKIEVMRAVVRLSGEVDGALCDKASYYDLKHEATTYQAAKRVVRGEAMEKVSATWAAMLPEGEFYATAAGEVGAPFAGWMVSPRKFEMFTAMGEVVQRVK